MDTVHLTAAEAAAYLRRSPYTMRDWRARGEGPRYVRRGRYVMYRRADLDAWLAAQMTETADSRASRGRGRR